MVKTYTDPSSAEPNTPGWEEDANSPLTVSNAQSGTITLDGTYDAVKLIVISGDVSAADIQVNGDTGANYDYEGTDGADTTGATAVENAMNPDRGAGQELVMSGRWDNAWSVDTGIMRPTGGAERGLNPSVTSPLDSITVKSSVSFNATIKVYGLNA